LHRINFFLKKGESTEHLKEEYRTPLTIKKGKTWEKERKDSIVLNVIQLIYYSAHGLMSTERYQNA